MDFVQTILELAADGHLRTSDHAYGRLEEKDISYRGLVSSLDQAEVLERYPDYRHGPCFLARHIMIHGRIAHAVWGLASSDVTVAVLVTAYWPDEEEWDEQMRIRR